MTKTVTVVSTKCIPVVLLILVVASIMTSFSTTNTVTHLPQYTAAQDKRDGPIDIVHVVNPFTVRNCEKPFCPFDQSQSVTFASMLRAQAKSRLTIVLAATVYEEDQAAVPQGFVHLPLLTRSTASEHPDLLPRNKLPFVQDIIDNLLKSGLEFKYMVFTNSDIVLHQNFYDVVQEQIDSGLDAFTINRKIIGTRKEDGSLYTKEDLDEIYRLTGRGHRGHDCFVAKRSSVEKLQMGGLFVGFANWGMAMRMQLEINNENFKAFESYDLEEATYHLGPNLTRGRYPRHVVLNRVKVLELEGMWCLCEEKRKKNPFACDPLYLPYFEKGIDISNVCPTRI